jgi:hypothetical protein
MTYDKIIKTATCPTYQYGTGFDKKRRIFFKGSDGIGKAISHLQTAGLPLYTRSRTDWKAGSNPGHQDCLYGEAIQEPDRGTSNLCKEYRAKLKRDSDPSTGSPFAKWSGAWLRGENASEKSSCTTAMTGCHRKRSCKCINSWFLRKYGNGFMHVIV